MIEKILEYGGVIFAAVGILCLFLEAIEMFRRKTNTKLTIAGLVLLTISVIGFLITDVILHDKDIPYFLTVIWIVLLWAYLICNIVSATLVLRKKRLDKSNQDNPDVTADEQSDDLNEDDANDADKQ